MHSLGKWHIWYELIAPDINYMSAMSNVDIYHLLISDIWHINTFSNLAMTGLDKSDPTD